MWIQNNNNISYNNNQILIHSWGGSRGLEGGREDRENEQHPEEEYYQEEHDLDNFRDLEEEDQTYLDELDRQRQQALNDYLEDHN